MGRNNQITERWLRERIKERPKGRFSVDRPKCVVCSRDGDLVQWLLATAVQCTAVTWCGGALNRGDLVQWCSEPR